MTFNPSPTISRDPDVKIFFEGLMLLYPEPDAGVTTCRALAINNHSAQHELFVEVSVDQPGPNLPFLRIGDKVKQLGLTISKLVPRGVTKYAGPRMPGVDQLDREMDFTMLNPGAVPNPGGGHLGVIRIRDGVLYVAKFKGPANLRRIPPPPPPAPPCQDLPTVGTILGARIDFSSVQLKLTSSAGAEYVSLPRDEDKEELGTHPRYTIWISNTRPTPPPASVGSDFRHLYHGINGATGGECDLNFMRCDEVLGEATTPRVPCIPGVIGG